MGDDMGYPILKLPHRVLQIFWDIQLTLRYWGHWKIIKKNGDAPGPLGDFVKSLVTERLFLFSVFLKKISINRRFFTQKDHLPAQKKKEVLHEKNIFRFS